MTVVEVAEAYPHGGSAEFPKFVKSLADRAVAAVMAARGATLIEQLRKPSEEQAEQT